MNPSAPLVRMTADMARSRAREVIARLMRENAPLVETAIAEAILVAYGEGGSDMVNALADRGQLVPPPQEAS